jgi:hypothetical protein
LREWFGWTDKTFLAFSNFVGDPPKKGIVVPVLDFETRSKLYIHAQSEEQRERKTVPRRLRRKIKSADKKLSMMHNRDAGQGAIPGLLSNLPIMSLELAVSYIRFRMRVFAVACQSTCIANTCGGIREIR